MNLPKESILQNTHKNFPYYIVGNDAFTLQQYTMKPYPGNDLSEKHKIFNYQWVDMYLSLYFLFNKHTINFTNKISIL